MASVWCSGPNFRSWTIDGIWILWSNFFYNSKTGSPISRLKEGKKPLYISVRLRNEWKSFSSVLVRGSKREQCTSHERWTEATKKQWGKTWPFPSKLFYSRGGSHLGYIFSDFNCLVDTELKSDFWRSGSLLLIWISINITFDQSTLQFIILYLGKSTWCLTSVK